MRSLTFATFMLMATASAGQNFFGVKAGLNLTNMNDGEYMDWRARMLGGLSFERFVSERHSVGADLIFNQRGFKTTVQYSGQGGGTGGESDLKYNFNYLSVPVKISRGFTKNGPVFGSVGLIPSFLINSKAKTKFSSVDLSEDLTEKVKKFDLAGQVEIGLRYAINDKYSFIGSVAFQYSFTSVTTDEFFSNTEFGHYGLTISGGITMKR